MRAWLQKYDFILYYYKRLRKIAAFRPIINPEQSQILVSFVHLGRLR